MPNSKSLPCGPVAEMCRWQQEVCVVMTLADITGPDQYLRAPRIDRSEVRLLWHSDYCDGPRSGMLVFRSEECWFQVVSESEDDGANWYRPFLVLRLSPGQHTEERQWHELFREKVGPYTDYDEHGQRLVGSLQPREGWNEFYD